MKKLKRALFIGRFQPFHKGHEYVINELLKKYDEVIIVIGSAEHARTPVNPFTAGERVDMIRSCFSKTQLSQLLIVPVRDVNNNTIWVKHVLSYVPSFECFYSNNELVRKLFINAGIITKKIKFLKRNEYTGTLIRKKMIKGNDWKDSVPGAAWVVINNHIKKRLR